MTTCRGVLVLVVVVVSASGAWVVGGQQRSIPSVPLTRHRQGGRAIDPQPKPLRAEPSTPLVHLENPRDADQPVNAAERHRTPVSPRFFRRLPVDVVPRRTVVASASGPVGSTGDPSRLVYSNTEGTFVLGTGTAGALLADDITVLTAPGCNLSRYEFLVTGNRTGEGVNQDPFSVDFSLYDACPGAGGTAIPGTEGHVELPDAGFHTVVFETPAAVDVPIPASLWIGVRFSTAAAGVAVGAPARVGFSADTMNFPGFDCDVSLGGFPRFPHASFHVEVYAADDCGTAFVGYRASGQSSEPFVEGAPIQLADDISLARDDCRMVAYEVAVKATGPGVGGGVLFDLRTELSNENPFDGGVIAGTRRQASVFSDAVQVHRFAFDPPIPVPRDFWLAVRTNAADVGPLLVNDPPPIGTGRNLFASFDEAEGVWEFFRVSSPPPQGSFDVTIFCAGEAPLGACCDTLFPASDGQPVCRDVPRLNCPLGRWQEAMSCATDPFESVCGPVVRDGFESVQVNVSGDGFNIAGDAANEPSIAVDPTNPERVVIGWRQFDTVTSNFRQAGWAHSADSGVSWTFPGVLEPGQFRSDPSLDADPDGAFYFYSISTTRSAELFKSIDGGLSWEGPIPAFGGDKPWMAIDPTEGPGRGNIYAMWTPFSSCCNGMFTRSTDAGLTFDEPINVPLFPFFGTATVGPEGTLYLAGTGASITRSTNAKMPDEPVVFDLARFVDLGGFTSSGGAPNPGGLLGHVWVATDHSDGPTRGNVYLLASIDPVGPDPLDVMFARSTDRGQTWSQPVRVNDDPVDTGAWQWFGTMSVAPTGRIDVVWNDTRNGGGAGHLSEVFYSSSLDAGETWSSNIPVTPQFNSLLGFPQQRKIGDYYHMRSDIGGANLAYAATFNGEQDIYFLRIPVDCNGNGIEDPTEIADGSVDDCNVNGVPDECEPDEDCNENGTQDICDIASGTSDDCNRNLVPDTCEPPDDCNHNDVQDICDVSAEPGSDENENGIPDECERTFSQPPLGIGEEVISNIDWIDRDPNVLIVDDFVSDGRPITAIRWWGSDFLADPPRPVNDQCADAILLNESGALFTNINADTDGPIGSCMFISPDVWFDYVAPCDGVVTIDTCGSSFDTVVEVFAGCGCDALIAGIACNDDATSLEACGGTTQSAVRLVARAGDCFKLRIGGFAGDEGEGVVTARCAPGVQTDLFASDPRTGLLGTVDPDTGFFVPLSPFRAQFGSVTEIEWDLSGTVIYASTGAGSGLIETIDPDTGELLGVAVQSMFGALNGLEFNATGELLGTLVAGGGSPSSLVRVDPVTGVITLIGPTGFSNIGGLAFDASFTTLFGITSGGSNPPILLSIDPQTGAAGVIATTTMTSEASSLEFSADGRLLTAGGDGVLYELDPGTGAATAIGPLENAVKLSGLSLRPSSSDSASVSAASRRGGMSHSTIRSVLSGIDSVAFTSSDDEDPGGGVCGADSGSCCAANGSAGCDDVGCCQAICLLDPFCCDDDWDLLCAQAARTQCGACGVSRIDGWLVSVYEPVNEQVGSAAALGAYFCATEQVASRPADDPTCDERSVLEYAVDLSDCCLVHTRVDSRTGVAPASPEAFFEESCLDYSLSVQAVVGRRFIDDGTGTCIEASGSRPVRRRSWGWHTQSRDAGARPALIGALAADGASSNGPFSVVDTGCAAPNMAFELITAEPGDLSDQDGDGVPDACSCFVPSSPQAAPCCPASDLGSAVRYLSFAAGDPGRRQALRVSFRDLQPPYDALNGTSLWVGPPQTFSERADVRAAADAPESPTFRAAQLQCEPYFFDWHTAGTVHVYHGGIVPSGTYLVSAVDETCMQTPEVSFSSALVLHTSRWGDVVTDCTTPPCSPPDGRVDIVTDVVAVLDKFANLGVAVAKRRADIEPAVPDQIVDMADVVFVLDGFQGLLYPFTEVPVPCAP